MNKPKYPKFQQHQLIEYKGDNPLIIKYTDFIVKKFISTLPNLDLETGIIQLLTKPKFAPLCIFCNPANMGKIISEIKRKNEQLKTEGKKMFFYINVIRNSEVAINKFIPVYKHNNVDVDPEINEYLLKNFRYEGYAFPETHKIKIGERNERYLQEQFNTTKDIKEVQLDKLIGETDEKFHVKYKKFNFFLYKDDPDLENPVETLWKSLDIDFDVLNKMNKNQEWVEKGYQLNEHQEEGIKFLVYNKKGFIFDTTGLGKSLQAFYSSVVVKSKKTLILTILEDKIKWKRLVEECGFRANLLGGTKKINYDEDAEYDILNYESLDKYCKKGAKINLLEKRYECVIADECHNLRNSTSTKSKRANKIFNKTYVKYIFGLSATAVEKNEHFMDMCSIMNIEISTLIPLWNSGYNSFKERLDNFRLTYCNGVMMKNRDKTFIATGLSKDKDGLNIYNTNTYELAQRIKYSFLCRTNEDIPNFPIKRIHELKVEMTPFEQSEYERYKMQLKAKYRKINKEKEERNEMTINEDLPMLVKLREFLSKVSVPHTVNFALKKAKAGEKFIIFTHFKEEFELLCQYLAGYAVWVNAEKKGRWRNKENHEIVEEFKKSKEHNIIIGNIQTLGTAHNIPEAHHTMINSPNWNNGEHEQAMGRNWRLNTPHDVNAWFWIVEDSEVEVVYNRSKSKKNNTQILLGIN